MLKVTTRYLASNFIPPFALGFVFFVAFLITFYMFRIIALIVNKGVEISVVLGLVTDLSVSFFPMATPLAVFFATIYTLNKFSEDSEIIAMRSFGITKFKIYMPFLFCSLLIGATNYSLSNIYIPKANANFKNTIVKLSSSGMLTSIKEGQFFTDIPNVTLFADKVSEDGNSFDKVFLHSKSGNEQRVIFARTGELKKIENSDQLVSSLRLKLKDGNIVKIGNSGAEIEKILFEVYDFPIFQNSSSLDTLDKDSMKTNRELAQTIKEKKLSHEELIAKKDKIDNYDKLFLNSQKSLVKSQVEYLTRHVTFFQIVFFVLLAFSLGVKKGRGASANNTGKAIIILLSYYALYFFLISMAQRGVIGPMLATVSPVILLLLSGMYYFRKLDWAS